MRNLMTYSELSDYCKDNKIELKSLSQSIGITVQGLAKGMKKQSLSMKVVSSLCEKLGITPNQVFGWNESESEQTARDAQGMRKGCTMVANDNMLHKQVQNGGIGNTQHMDVLSTKVLQEQLRIKDEQLKAKDEQISKLMDLLAK